MAVVIESTATEHSAANSTALTIDKPAGTAEGDLLVAVLAGRDDDGTNSFTTLTGWTAVAFQGEDTGSGNTMIGLFYKKAGASEPTSYTWTQAESRRFAGFIHRITGLDADNPVDVFATVEDDSFDATADAPSVTPTSADRWLFCAVAGPSNETITAPPGMTLAGAVSDVALSVGGAYEQLTTSDPTGVRQFTADWGRGVGLTVAFIQEADVPSVTELSGRSSTATATSLSLVSVTSLVVRSATPTSTRLSIRVGTAINLRSSSSTRASISLTSATAVAGRSSSPTRAMANLTAPTRVSGRSATPTRSTITGLTTGSSVACRSATSTRSTAHLRTGVRVAGRCATHTRTRANPATTIAFGLESGTLTRTTVEFPFGLRLRSATHTRTRLNYELRIVTRDISGTRNLKDGGRVFGDGERRYSTTDRSYR